MRVVFRMLIGLALLQVAAFAADGPEVQVADGKVSISAQAIPLGRLLSLLDRAVGMNSEVLKPELANRNINVRFTDLELKDAVRKIFEGQPLNYMLIEGKGIRVMDLAQGGGTSTSTASSTSSSPFQDSQPIINGPQVVPGAVQTITPANPVNQPAAANNPFGGQPTANTNTNNGQNASIPVFTPGQLPPPIGASNPLVSPVGAAGAPAVPTGFPGASAPAAQPAGPGTLGATPGVIR